MGKVEQRRLAIVEILNDNPIVSLTELAKQLSVTTETIRSDLKSPQLIDRVVQAHGSVALAHTTIARDIPYSFRKELNSRAKSKIAEEACRLIKPGQVIVIEHNSISVMLIHTLGQQPQLLHNVTVVTNSFSIMQYVQEKRLDISLVFLGGIFSLSQENSYGSVTVKQMRELKADISFLSPGGINEALEITAYKERDADLQRAIIANSTKNILLIEKGKYPSIAMWKVNHATDYHGVITEAAFTAKQLNQLKEKQVHVYQV